MTIKLGTIISFLTTLFFFGSGRLEEATVIALIFIGCAVSEAE